MTDSIIGRYDGRTYKTEKCPDCGAPMMIASKNYMIDEFGIKHFLEKETLLFNVCEKCRVQTPITENQRQTCSDTPTEVEK